MIDADAIRPSPDRRASTRKTGSSASRTNPIALGIVHGLSGWPRVVCGGARRPVERQRPLLLAAPDLRLDLARLDAALAHGQPQRDAEQLGVGELLARTGRALVVENVEAL